MADQEAAACGIVSAVAERMSEEQWREVVGSLLAGETKYVGSDEPAAASSTRVDYREWLDAVDERGLVPAGQADPAFAANLEELDFAQDLLARLRHPDRSRGAREALRARAPATTSSSPTPRRWVRRCPSARPWTTGSSTTP